MKYFYLLEINTYTTWLEIDLNAIKHNTALVREKTGVEVMAIIKANGYGNGACPVAQAAIAGGAIFFAYRCIFESFVAFSVALACSAVSSQSPLRRLISAS